MSMELPKATQMNSAASFASCKAGRWGGAGQWAGWALGPGSGETLGQKLGRSR